MSVRSFACLVAVLVIRTAQSTVSVNASTGPFAVTAPNTAISWPALSAQTVTWSVNGTNALAK